MATCVLCGKELSKKQALCCSKICAARYVGFQNRGRKHSVAMRKKRSEIAKQQFSTVESRQKHSAIMKQALADPIVRQKYSEATKRVYTDPAARQQRSLAAKRQWEDPAARQALSEAIKRTLADPVLRQKMSERLKQQWSDPVEYEKGLERLKQAREQLKTDAGRQTMRDVTRRRYENPAERQRQSDRQNQYWGNLSSEDRAERIAKASKANNPSSLERAICQVLDTLGIAYETQVPFANGRYIADIYVPEKNLVIECNGEYWHNLPERINRDRKFEAYLTHNGYKILWLWERDIVENPEEALFKGLTQVMGG